MAITLMIISGILGAMTNFCIRKNLEFEKNARGFFIFQLFITFLVAVILHPCKSGLFGCNLPTFIFGFGAGLALGFMKLMIEKAMQNGPSGLTFAAVNSATVAPTFLIVATAGSLIDYHISLWDIAGSILIVCGLFWAGWDEKNHGCQRSWSMFAALAFLCYVGFLIFTELRSLIASKQLQVGQHESMLPADMTSEWFSPIVFGTAAGLHFLLFVTQERRVPVFKEINWGILGGVFNGLCMYFFMRAAEMATMKENTYIYSVFSISLIIGCNLWAERCYNERVNWKANTLCLIGIFLASN